MSRRTEMIGSTLQQELMVIIMHELDDPRVEGTMPSITRVEVATDLSAADVYVTIMGTEGKQTAALNALKHSAGMMRAKLMKTLPMRTVPFLKFHFDERLKRELGVLELIEQARREYAPQTPAEASSESIDTTDANEAYIVALDGAAPVAPAGAELSADTSSLDTSPLDATPAVPRT